MASGEAKKPNKPNASAGKKKEVKKETGLGLSNKKDENFGEWYSEVCFLVLGREAAHVKGPVS